MKESKNTSSFQKTTLHCEGRLAHSSFPCRTSTCAFQKTTLHHEINIMHTSIPYSISTIAMPKNALPKTTLHHEGNLTHAIFLSIMKESTRTSSFSMHHE
jgi:hypothetical protein